MLYLHDPWTWKHKKVEGGYEKLERMCKNTASFRLLNQATCHEQAPESGMLTPCILKLSSVHIQTIGKLHSSTTLTPTATGYEGGYSPQLL